MADHGIRLTATDPDAQVVELAAIHARDRGNHRSIERRDVRWAERELDHVLKVAAK